jgi:hypothetical protein
MGHEENLQGMQEKALEELERETCLKKRDDMTQTLFIPGPLPVLNNYLGKGQRWTYNAAKKRYGAMIGLEIRRQHLKPMGRVFILWTWQEQDQRRDPDNFSGIGKKFILDALVTMCILNNDGWKQIAGWTDTWVVVPDRPGVTVILEEVEQL